MSSNIDLGFCIICGMIHPKNVPCSEMNRVQEQVQAKIADAYRTGTVWMNRLVNWRTVILGKLWGTRPSPDRDPPTQMARDLLAGYLSLLAGFNALTKLWIEGGEALPGSADDQRYRMERLSNRIEQEAEWLCRQYERAFPGIKAVDLGLEMDPIKIQETMKDWPK